MFEPQRVMHRNEILALGVSGPGITKLVALGVLTRLWRGFYTMGQAIGVPDPRGVTRSMRVVLSHQSAVAWWGADLPEPADRLHVTAPRNRGRVANCAPGVRLHRASLLETDVVVVRGVRVTTPLRTVIDIARLLPTEAAVIVADAFARLGLLTGAEVSRAAAAMPVGRGRPAVRRVAELMDEKAGSVFETRTRLLIKASGIPQPVTQFVVRSRGRWIGRVDFAWPELRVVVECDGFEFHSGRDAFERDRRRWNALTRAGWRVVLVTWSDLRDRPDHVVELISSALAEARSSTHRGHFTAYGGRV